MLSRAQARQHVTCVVAGGAGPVWPWLCVCACVCVRVPACVWLCVAVAVAVAVAVWLRMYDGGCMTVAVCLCVCVAVWLCGWMAVHDEQWIRLAACGFWTWVG